MKKGYNKEDSEKLKGIGLAKKGKKMLKKGYKAEEKKELKKAK